MPGRTPYEAVESFLAPLRAALGCVARAKITTSRGGVSPKVGETHQWSINNGGGVELRRASTAGSGRARGKLELFASMWWCVIEDADNGPLRVSTRGYGYSLVLDDEELWAMQWQPDGPSPEKKPHLHLGPSLLAASAPITSKAHLRTGRMTFETAIRWCIEFGAEPRYADWNNRLTLAEGPHLLYRSWHQEPPASIMSPPDAPRG
jgi:hypothetical protein